ncbi:unnamed protein product, partial [Ectocarpus sp. 6 AP-2014]
EEKSRGDHSQDLENRQDKKAGVLQHPGVGCPPKRYQELSERPRGFSLYSRRETHALRPRAVLTRCSTIRTSCSTKERKECIRRVTQNTGGGQRVFASGTHSMKSLFQAENSPYRSASLQQCPHD